MAIKLIKQHENTTTIALRVTKRQKADLKRWCKQRNMTISDLFKKGAEEYMISYEKSHKTKNKK